MAAVDAAAVDAATVDVEAVPEPIAEPSYDTYAVGDRPSSDERVTLRDLGPAIARAPARLAPPPPPPPPLPGRATVPPSLSRPLRGR
jgi:hypothetical protein